MGQYFHGWRCKIGALTLMMACLFMAAWVRSQNTTDFLVISTYRGSFGITSDQRGFFFGSGWFTDGRVHATLEWPEWKSRTSLEKYKSPKDPTELQNGCRSLFRLRYGEFGFLVFESDVFHQSGVKMILPYWSITTPLMLISCWLLLSKPRQINRGRSSCSRMISSAGTKACTG